MDRVKSFDATGVAPNGRLYAGDLNGIQDAAAALMSLTQILGVGTLEVGESGLQVVRYGAGEARVTGALRTDGILRGLGGFLPGVFTTTQRNAIGAGLAPYGIIILNSTTNQFEWNAGTDGARNWQAVSLSGVAAGGDLSGTYPNPTVANLAITAAKIANTTITNAQIAAAAAIAYSKLNLAASIVNADIGAAAAIAISKLADPGSGKVIGSLGAGAVAVSPPGTQIDFATVTGTVSFATVSTEGTAVQLIASNNVAYDGTSIKVQFSCPKFIGTAGASKATLVLLRDATIIGQVIVGSLGTAPGVGFYYEFPPDTPAAGNHIYSIKAFGSGGNGETANGGTGGTGNPVAMTIKTVKA